jgi:hypothetical protein
MADIIDIGLVGDAQRLLERLIDERGIGFFLDRESKRLVALQPAKIDLVVKAALRSKKRRVPPSVVERCRRHVRRILIREVARAMLASGC